MYKSWPILVLSLAYDILLIQVEFEEKTYIETIEIFEVRFPGGVISIELLNTGSGSYTAVYNANAVYISNKSRILTVKVPIAKQVSFHLYTFENSLYIYIAFYQYTSSYCGSKGK